jgi:hypothetical protein
VASTSPGSVGSIEVIGDPSVVHQPAPQGYLNVHTTLIR